MTHHHLQPAASHEPAGVTLAPAPASGLKLDAFEAAPSAFEATPSAEGVPSERVRKLSDELSDRVKGFFTPAAAPPPASEKPKNDSLDA